MKEIKFRVFCKTEIGQPLNKFIYSDEFKYYNENYRMYAFFKYLSDQEIEHDGLQLFSGLKDKNGIEIYEGDILERDDDKEHLLTVIFKDGMFGFYDTDPMAKELYPNSDSFTVIAGWVKYSKLIVVGNIYENPELLNKE